MPSPNKTLLTIGAAAGAALAIGGHEAISNHPVTPDQPAPLEVQGNIPTTSLDGYLGKSATHNTTITHDDLKPHIAAPTTETPNPISPAVAPVENVAPSVPEAAHEPAKPDTGNHATKDGEDATNDPSTQASDFETSSPETSDDGPEITDEGGKGTYEDTPSGFPSPDEGGEMGPDPDQDQPVADDPGETQGPAPEADPYANLAQEFSTYLFNNDPGNKRSYITGVTRIYDAEHGIGFNITNAPYELFNVDGKSILFIGYHSPKGGGEDAKSHLGYKVFDGEEAINGVSVMSKNNGSSVTEPALTDNIGLLYENSSNASFTGQYGIELGKVDSDQPTSATAHLTVKDGQIALEAYDYTQTK